MPAAVLASGSLPSTKRLRFSVIALVDKALANSKLRSVSQGGGAFIGGKPMHNI